jgi:hypothetical protein
VLFPAVVQLLAEANHRKLEILKTAVIVLIDIEAKKSQQ